MAAYPQVMQWAEVEKAVKRLFSKEVESGLLPMGGEIGDMKIGFDSKKTTDCLGIEFHGIEAMVKSLVGQYVELIEKERKDTTV